ncbi:MAG: hypothetical protein IPL73_22355 [Candidatus Obscuribacter sp.]|nr:hypothetical protein [Candidatus Obscuribacter sp.]
MTQARTLQFYMHTHWDREWYWNFNAYRSELISVVRAVIAALDSGTIDKFMLDGQTSLIEDTLAVAPELAEPIKRLAKSGKLAIGPWYVLADQMLVGGESLVRNLAIGIRDAQALGAVDRVGYCPDTFGHTVDLPRILNGFAIGNAILWRGVPPLSGGPLFEWASPDKSSVLTLQLNRGYYQTAFHEDLSEAIMQRYLLGFIGLEPDGPDGEGKESEPITKLKAGTKPSSLVDITGSALVPVGGDHLMPPANFASKLTALTSSLNKLTPVVSEQVSLFGLMGKLAQAVKADNTPLQYIQDELRDNQAAFVNERAYMLDGVLSTRLYLKRDNRLAEHCIVKTIEPFLSWLAVRGVHPYPTAEMLYSWRLLLQNQPHDSICGCSIDEVHREMLTRTASLSAGLTVLTRQGIEALAADGSARHGLGRMLLMDPDSKAEQICVFNSSRLKLSQPVAVSIALLDNGDSAASRTVLSDPLLQISKIKNAREAFNTLGGVPAFKQVTVVDGYYYAKDAASLALSRYNWSPLTGAAAQAVLPALATSEGDDTGYSGDAQIMDMEHLPFGLLLTNQYYKVYLQQNGELTVETPDKQYRLGHNITDVADAGDTYNFDPLPGDKPIKAQVAAVRAGESGPFVASLLVDYIIDIPLNLEPLEFEPRLAGEPGDAPQVRRYRRNQSCNNKHLITVEMTLKKGVPILFFDASWHNWSEDHRLEVVFNCFESIKGTVSENHYSLVGRPLLKEESSEIMPLGHESPPGKLPCQRFFYTDKEIYFNSGLPEYGATKNTVSYTLLRAVSDLSRDRLRTRGGGAGPSIATPEANCLLPLQVSYGWAPLTAAQWLEDKLEEAPASAAYALAEVYEGPLKAFLLPGKSQSASDSAPLISWQNDAIQLSALYMDAPGTLLVRLLNTSAMSHKQDFVLSFVPASATLVTLEQVDLAPLSLACPGSLASGHSMIEQVPLLAYQLITIKIVLKP